MKVDVLNKGDIPSRFLDPSVRELAAQQGWEISYLQGDWEIY